MILIAIASIVVALAAGVTGYIAGVAVGTSTVLRVAYKAVGTARTKLIMDALDATQGKVPPAPRCTNETGCLAEREGARTAPCAYACERDVEPTPPPRRL